MAAEDATKVAAENPKVPYDRFGKGQDA